MTPERKVTPRQDLRWRVGLLVFGLMLVVGGACAWGTLRAVRADAEHEARAHARAIAQSVADTLAHQLARAARVGIPLPELPGVPDYLQALLARQPALSAVAVESPPGHVLHAVGRPAGLADEAAVVQTDIAAVGGTVGTVRVASDGQGASRQGLGRALALAALAVWVVALVAACAAALGPGARLEAQRRTVLARLQRPEAEPLPEPVGGPAPGPQALWHALAEGDAAQRAADQALQGYAHELLAVDFDGQMRAEIDRVLRAAAPTQAREGD